MKHQKISLCVIAGNEAVHATRFLKSFAPAFDELCLVRAIGSKQPDDTEQICAKWCEENGKAYQFSEYENAPSASAWPHVDNFAAARQHAFNLATGDRILWADFDDILLGDAAEKIREAASEHNEDALFFTYELPGQHEGCLRERLIRPGCGAWKNALHENFELVHGATWRLLPEIKITHAPLDKKGSDPKRNHRILSAAIDGMPRNLYNLAREAMVSYSAAKCAGDKTREEMAALAKEVHDLFAKSRALGGVSPEEKQVGLLYEVACHRDANEHDLACEKAWDALAACPDRRAPYGALAECYLDADNARFALAVIRAMKGIPLPPPSGLAIDSRMHEWHGVELYQRTLRAAGREEEAREMERKVFGGQGKPLSVLHATRGRAKQALFAREIWLAAAHNPASIEWIFAIDEDDAESRHALRHHRRVVVPGKGSCVKAWNAAYDESEGHVIIQMSDDWWPCVHWDLIILDRLNEAAKKRGGTIENTPLALAINDGARNDDLLAMAICTRSRVEQQEGGHLFWPEYDGMYSDTEYSRRAWDDGVVVDARSEITIEHRHPAFGKAAMDATYEKQNASEQYERGRAIFEKRNPL
jgi:hypothetical protein